jgi:hypothetical protein
MLVATTRRLPYLTEERLFEPDIARARPGAPPSGLTDSGPEIVFVPMLLIGLGIGALASQLGAVTDSAVPDDQRPEVGGVQNTRRTSAPRWGRPSPDP